jgi:YbgC/YbaW family acyl-CoA thioester hydrolase
MQLKKHNKRSKGVAPMEHEYLLEVRGYEMDSFNHVNNAVYLNYFEAARWKFLEDRNWINYAKFNKLHLVVTEINIHYSSELKVFDKAIVKSQWEHEGQYLIANQSICLEGSNRKMAKAKVKMILVSHDRIMHELPDFIRNELDNKVVL